MAAAAVAAELDGITPSTVDAHAVHSAASVASTQAGGSDDNWFEDAWHTVKTVTELGVTIAGAQATAGLPSLQDAAATAGNVFVSLRPRRRRAEGRRRPEATASCRRPTAPTSASRSRAAPPSSPAQREFDATISPENPAYATLNGNVIKTSGKYPDTDVHHDHQRRVEHAAHRQHPAVP